MPTATLPRPTLFTLLVALAPLLLGGCDDHANQGLVIQGHTSDPTRPYFHSFGTIAEGEVAAHTFELINTDDKEVKIQRVTPACSCTVGKVYALGKDGSRHEGDMRASPVLTVPSGGTVFIEFQMDSRQVAGKNTDKLAIVSVSCDSPNQPFLRFELHTVVSVPLQATPLPLDLKEVPQSSGGYATTQVARALPSTVIRVTGVESASAELEVTIDELNVLGTTVWAVTAQLEPGLPMGPYQGEIRLGVTGDDGEATERPFVIPVRARVVQDVVMLPAILSFGRFSPESTGARAVGLLQAMVPGDRVNIRAAEIVGADAEGLTVEYAAIEPDSLGRSGRWNVAVVAPPSLDGTSFSGVLSLLLDHPSMPRVEARFVGRPR